MRKEVLPAFLSLGRAGRRLGGWTSSKNLKEVVVMEKNEFIKNQHKENLTNDSYKEWFYKSLRESYRNVHELLESYKREKNKMLLGMAAAGFGLLLLAVVIDKMNKD